jgi:divalent metal cation (Fe/Co/Zn/Cd) transporter
VISVVSYAHNYPLAPCGGLFVFTVGFGVTLGAIFPRLRNSSLAASGVVAVLEMWAFGASLTAPLGVPTPFQVWSLVVAVAFEIAVVAIVVAQFRKRGERTLRLGILLAVGSHFLLMAPAFGPLIVLLGLLAILNALLGLRSPSLSVRTLWLTVASSWP